MSRRPWALVILAILHFLAPIGNIVFNAIIADRDIMNYLVYAMSPGYLSQNWIIVVAPVVAGYSIYSCKKWSFYLYIVSITALFIFSYSGYMVKAGSVGIFPIIIVYLCNIALVTYFLLPAVRNIYFDRRLRWWEIQNRYKCNFRCSWISLADKSLGEGIVENISENGMFMKSDVQPEDGEEIKIVLPFNHGVEMVFHGITIIHDRVDAVGFGIKFVHNKESLKNSKHLVLDLDQKGMCISSMGGRPEDSFSYWIRTLLTSGKGLFPRDKD